MRFKKSFRKRKILSVLVTALLAVGIYVFYLYGDRLNAHVLEGKRFHTTSATVIKKERVLIDKDNRWFTDDFGDRIEVPVDTEQWRVYYTIDNFDQVNEPIRGRLADLETNVFPKDGTVISMVVRNGLTASESLIG
ncbi:MAG: hypothetical protein ABIO91_04505 [Pyrinomonadaceae bacterium]